ncbi:MAG: MFS transporter [Gaiellales bacterium]
MTLPTARPGGRTAPGPLTVLGVSLAALAAGAFATVGIGALAPELQADLDFSRAEIGVLTAMNAAGAAFASRRAGRLTDAVGPARVLVLSLALFAAMVATWALAPTGAVFMAAVLVAGLAYGGINPPTNVVIAGQLAQRLGLFMSIKQTGVPIGGFLAGLVLPSVAIAAGWRAAFGVAAAFALAIAVWGLRLRGAAVLRGRGEERREDGLPLRERLGISVYGALMAGTQWVFLTYLVLYLTDAERLSLHLAGAALAVATAASVAGRLAWGWLSDRRGKRTAVLVAASGAAAAMLALLAAGAGGPAVWPIVAVTGAALVGWNGVFHALIADRAGPGRLGRLSGETMTFVFGGAVVVPPLLGLISERTDSWTLLWALAAALAVLSALVLVAGLRPRPARVTGERVGPRRQPRASCSSTSWKKAVTTCTASSGASSRSAWPIVGNSYRRAQSGTASTMSWAEKPEGARRGGVMMSRLPFVNRIGLRIVRASGSRSICSIARHAWRTVYGEFLRITDRTSSKIPGFSSMKSAETAWIVTRSESSSSGSASDSTRQFRNIVRR